MDAKLLSSLGFLGEFLILFPANFHDLEYFALKVKQAVPGRIVSN